MNKLQYYQYLLEKVKNHFNELNKNKVSMKNILDFHDIYYETCHNNKNISNIQLPYYLEVIKKRIYRKLKTFMVHFQNEDELNDIMSCIDHYVKNVSKHNLKILLKQFKLLSD